MSEILKPAFIDFSLPFGVESIPFRLHTLFFLHQPHRTFRVAAQSWHTQHYLCQAWNNVALGGRCGYYLADEK